MNRTRSKVTQNILEMAYKVINSIIKAAILMIIDAKILCFLAHLMQLIDL